MQREETFNDVLARIQQSSLPEAEKTVFAYKEWDRICRERAEREKAEAAERAAERAERAEREKAERDRQLEREKTEKRYRYLTEHA